MSRLINEHKLTDTATNGCEGCQHNLHAGIRWPASPDGYFDLSYVDRCDYCELYSSDEAAAKALAEHYGVRWGWAYRTAKPKTDEDIRWEPAEDDGLNYTGWSCFIDHPARDGDPEYVRDGEWQTLDLNPGQARALYEAMREALVSMASEYSSGEFWAHAMHDTLENLMDEIHPSNRR